MAGLTPSARGRIRAHLTAHPDALVTGASLAPRSVQALISTLTAAGVAEVRAPACLRCGRVRPLRRAVPGGRVCLGCEGILAAQSDVGPCAACGETRPARVTRPADHAAGNSCRPAGPARPAGIARSWIRARTADHGRQRRARCAGSGHRCVPGGRSGRSASPATAMPGAARLVPGLWPAPRADRSRRQPQSLRAMRRARGPTRLPALRRASLLPGKRGLRPMRGARPPWRAVLHRPGRRLRRVHAHAGSSDRLP